MKPMSIITRNDFDSFNAAMKSYFLAQPNATMFGFSQFAMDNPSCRKLLVKLASAAKEQKVAYMATVMPMTPTSMSDSSFQESMDESD